jgi:Icc-related predicted phosphoesterase
MRLLVVADLHYALPQYDWLTEVAPRFDIVVVAGDHLDTNSLVDLGAQSIVIQKYIGRLSEKTRLLICSGNHDLDARNDAGEKVTRWILNPRSAGVPTDGDSFIHEDTLFTICPWWDGPIVREAIGRQLAADAAVRGDRRWIWLHHAPPRTTPISWDGQRSYGDVELEEWITMYRPDIVFCGHVHQAPFVNGGSWIDRMGSTWVFNAGRQYGAPPTYVVVDTDKQLALWFSAAGNQIARLDQPLERPVPKLTELPDWLV